MVSLFAFIHFCSLFSSTSTNLSSWLKLLPEIKQFVSSANSFTITWSNDLFISFINKRNNIGPRIINYFAVVRKSCQQLSTLETG